MPISPDVSQSNGQIYGQKDTANHNHGKKMQKSILTFQSFLPFLMDFEMISEILKKLEKTKKMGLIPASKLKPFKNGGQLKMNTHFTFLHFPPHGYRCNRVLAYIESSVTVEADPPLEPPNCDTAE
jgi:hypothetical protein